VPNMLGAMFQRGHKAGIIRHVGYTQTARVTGHGRVQRVWRGI
jgi:hypothetical protein